MEIFNSKLFYSKRVVVLWKSVSLPQTWMNPQKSRTCAQLGTPTMMDSTGKARENMTLGEIAQSLPTGESAPKQCFVTPH